MTTCHRHASGSVELYFYGELTGADRAAFERHLSACAECHRAIEDLKVIRTALDSRPDVAAPPAGDWSGFMTRLESAIRAEPAPGHAPTADVDLFKRRRPLVPVLAAAALLALVTMSVLRLRDSPPPTDRPVADVASTSSASFPAIADRPALDPALASVTGEHFTRSKLVVLGLAAKDPADANATNWEYERALATSLLNDTRLYRQTVEERGMKGLADVMRDLELVLLQTSMSAEPDAESLAQIQRLIRRRDLIAKMDVVSTTGLVP